MKYRNKKRHLEEGKKDRFNTSPITLSPSTSSIVQRELPSAWKKEIEKK